MTVPEPKEVATPDAPQSAGARNGTGRGATEVRIRRHTQTDHFTVLPNALLRDPNLSARGLGVLVRLLSLPDGWRTTAERLAQQFPEGRDAIRTALSEIEAAGYLRRSKAQNVAGRWSTTWDLTDDPASWPDTPEGLFPQVTPETDFQASVFQASVSQASIRSTEEERTSSSSPSPVTANAAQGAGGGESTEDDLDALPEPMRRHRSVRPGPIRKAVRACRARGWTLAQLRHELRGAESADTPGAVALVRLRDLVDVDPPPIAPERPAWCGTCHEGTRRLEDIDDGHDLGPCPACHPQRDRAEPSTHAVR